MALDQQALALTKAIRDAESGGSKDPYKASGASGETGAYQFMPETWHARAAKYLGNANAPQDRITQNKVQYLWVKDMKDKGYTAAQIASMHNAGEGRPNAYKENWKGVNSQGVAYDTPAYVGKVKQAYMKYKPQTTVETPPPAPVAPSKPLYEKASDFLGTTKLGKALGATAAVIGGTANDINESAIRGAEADRQKAELLKRPDLRPEQRVNLMKQLGQATAQPVQTATEAMPEINYTPEEIYGSALNTAALALPGSVGVAKGAGLGARVAGTALGGMLAGGAMGAGNAMQENKGIKDVALNAAKSAALGGVLGSGGELAATGLSKVLPKVAGKVAGTALKEPLREVKKGIVYGNESLGEKAVKLGYKGTDNQIYQAAEKNLDNIENRLQSVLKPNTNIVTREEVAGSKVVKNLIKEAKATPGRAEEATVIEKIVSELPEEMKISKANDIKRLIYKALGDRAYALDATLATKRNGMKAVANALKNLIEEKSVYTAGKGQVRRLNQLLADHGKIRDAALQNLARSNNRAMLGLSDYSALGVGGIIGGAPGAIAAEIAKRIAGTTFGKTWGAFLMAKIGNVITKIAPTVNSATLKLIIDGLSKIPPEELKKMDDRKLQETVRMIASSNKIDQSQAQ